MSYPCITTLSDVTMDVSITFHLILKLETVEARTQLQHPNISYSLALCIA